jgi:nitrous oxidase accessory protein NosD
MIMKIKTILVASVLVGASMAASAADWTVGDPMSAKSGGAVFPVGLYSDGVVSDAMIDLNYDAEKFVATVEAVNGAVCVVHPKGGVVRVISPDRGSEAVAKGMNLYCNVTLSARGAKSSAAPAALAVSQVWCNKSDASAVDCGSDGASASQ